MLPPRARLGSREDARDRSAKVAAQALYIREKLPCTDGAKNDTQALCGFRRRKAAGERGLAPGAFGARYRVLKVARAIADLEASETVDRNISARRFNTAL